MTRHIRSYQAGAVAIALSVLVLPAARAEVVTAKGEAEIVKGDRDSAEKLALAKAIKQAVEFVVGVTVKNNFTSRQKEVVQDNKDQFDSKIQDEIEQHSEGFIKRYDVKKKETAESDGVPVIRITIEADVYKDKVSSKLNELAALFMKAGKLMVALQEVYVSPDGKRTKWSTAQLPGMLEAELLKNGFTIIAKSEADELVQTDPEKFVSWMGRTAQAAQVASKEGADILVVGVLEINDKGVIGADEAGAFETLKGQRRLELKPLIRVIHTSTSQVIASQPKPMSTFGINVERAMFRALQGKSNWETHNLNLVDTVVDSIVTDAAKFIKDKEEKGWTYIILLEKVGNYAKQGMAFKKVMEGLKADGTATEVTTSFNDGVLTTELTTKCACDKLIEKIIEALGKAPEAIKNADLRQQNGKKIIFTL